MQPAYVGKGNVDRPTETGGYSGLIARSIELLESSKLETVDWPRTVIAERQARKTSISMAAYSTAVGPVSSARNRMTLFKRGFIV